MGKALQQMFAGQSTKDPGLLSFRAGRLFMDETTKIVTADKKRGKIKLLKDEQGLLKFQWWNRISNQKELDLTVFPSSAKWERIKECTDGRVYILRMTGTNRKHFFWMQEPEEEKDEEYNTKITKLCNGESIGDAKDNKDASSASSNNNNALGAFGGTNNQNTAANAAGSGQNAMAQMLLQAMGVNSNQNQSANANSASNDAVNGNLMQQMAAMMQDQQRAAMEDILDPSANKEILALLDDEKVVEELTQHLPESMRTRADMIEQIQSPQFQGALRRLQRAVNGPQMPSLLQQMGINESNQNAMGVTAFVNAIQPDDGKSSDDNEDKDKKDDDGDSAMKDDNDDKNKDKDKDLYK